MNNMMIHHLLSLSELQEITIGVVVLEFKAVFCPYFAFAKIAIV